MTLKYDATYHRWRVRRTIGGQEYSASFQRKDDALEWLRNKDREAGGLAPIPRAVTLAEAWVLYQAGLRQRGSPETTGRYYRVKYAALERVLGPAAVLNRLGPADIETYIDQRRREYKDLSNRTLHVELGLLRRMTVRAGETLRVDLVPQWTVPRLRIITRPRRAPTPGEVAGLWRELRGPARVAVALCLLTGCRASEAMRAKVEDVAWGERTLRLDVRKAGDPHIVPIVPTLASLLPRKSGPLVVASEDAVRSALIRASGRAHLAHVWSGPGLGRHCHATWAVQFGGYTTQQVADALGHRMAGAATPAYIHVQAVEPVRRPMAECVEGELLKALAGDGGQADLGKSRKVSN